LLIEKYVERRRESWVFFSTYLKEGKSGRQKITPSASRKGYTGPDDKSSRFFSKFFSLIG
jgi:hypothetical protein